MVHLPNIPRNYWRPPAVARIEKDSQEIWAWGLGSRALGFGSTAGEMAQSVAAQSRSGLAQSLSSFLATVELCGVSGLKLKSGSFTQQEPRPKLQSWRPCTRANSTLCDVGQRPAWEPCWGSNAQARRIDPASVHKRYLCFLREGMVRKFKLFAWAVKITACTPGGQVWAKTSGTCGMHPATDAEFAAVANEHTCFWAWDACTMSLNIFALGRRYVDNLQH